jgi:hypothetical protein
MGRSFFGDWYDYGRYDLVHDSRQDFLIIS